VDRQCPIETLAFNAGSLRNFGDALSLGKVPQGNEENTGLIFILPCSLEVLGGKIWVPPKPSNDGLVVRNAGFAFQEIPVLIFVIFEVSERPVMSADCFRL
jgi:hypothetical protein